MKRLIVGSVVSVSLIAVAACSGDPTESLRTGIVQLTATPSQVFVQQGRTAKVQVTAIDDQGNQISTSFAADNIGSGITVVRDETFQPVFVNDTTLQAPAEAPMFQFNVNAVDLVNTSFQLNAGGKNLTVPVTVIPDPAATVALTTAGATAADPSVVTVSAPFTLAPDASVTTGAGDAIGVSVAADGSSITFFPPPGSTGPATVNGLTLPYLPGQSFSAPTDLSLAIPATVPGNPATGSPATAPVLTIPASGGTLAFFDGAPMGAAVCGGNSGFPCQLYKFTLSADAVLDASLGWSNAADLGIYILDASTTDVAGAHCDANGRGDGNQPEACALTLTAGTYYLAVVSFGPGYPENDPNPDWISLSITTE